MPDGVISIDDPRADDVRELLKRHLGYARANTKPQEVDAPDIQRWSTGRDLLQTRVFSATARHDAIAMAAPAQVTPLGLASRPRRA